MNEYPDGALVVFSGGLDSTTVLAQMVAKHGSVNTQAVSFYYGQKHAIELGQAREIAELYGVKFHLIELPKIFGGAGSTLIDDGTKVETMGSYDDLAKKSGAQPTVVPNRNMVMIAMAVTLAITEGLGTVALGVHGTDSANFHYPDCRPAFIGAMQAATEIGNSAQVQIIAPFNSDSKADIVREAAILGVPVAMTQSCYSGVRPQCGQCATCHERQTAFIEAGFQDPTSYVEPHRPKSFQEFHALQEFPYPFNVPPGVHNVS